MASTFKRVCRLGALGGLDRRRVHLWPVRSFAVSCATRHGQGQDEVGLRKPVAVNLVRHNKMQLSSLLLRDLCNCPQCVNPSTRQKTFSTTDIPPLIQGNLISEGSESDEGSITIKWTNDVAGFDEHHTSKIPISTLMKLRNRQPLSSSQRLPRRILWDARMYQEQCPDVDYSSYMSDDSVVLQVLRQLRTHGMVFVTGVPEREESVAALAERIGPLKNTFYGMTWNVRSVPQAINVAYTSSNLGFHMDLLYMKNPPHIQLLHAIRPSSAGGASLFTDALKSAVDLAQSDMPAFGALASIPVDFHYDHPASQHYHRSRKVIESRPVQVGTFRGTLYQALRRRSESLENAAPFQLRVEDYITSLSWSPPFQAPFYTSTGIWNLAQGRAPGAISMGKELESWHTHACKFDKLIHRPEAIYERLMKPGECVLFDNRRVLHARRAFEEGDLGKERWLRGAYLDKDVFTSKFRTLSEQVGHGKAV